MECVTFDEDLWDVVWNQTKQYVCNQARGLLQYKVMKSQTSPMCQICKSAITDSLFISV